MSQCHLYIEREIPPTAVHIRRNGQFTFKIDDFLFRWFQFYLNICIKYKL